MYIQIKNFYKKEIKSFSNLLKPKFVFNLLLKHRYIHFFFVGISGISLNLLLTWIFTEFVFGGPQNYTYGYIISIIIVLCYNFILHTIFTFRTIKNHIKRFIMFIIYNIISASIQFLLVKIITNIIGVKYYIFIIGFVILLISTVTYLTFKLWIFKDKNE